MDDNAPDQAGTLAGFERAWRPDPYPPGMRSAYAYWSEDGQEVIGVSFWQSKDSCEAWRASQAEARRREAMTTYVVEERESFTAAASSQFRRRTRPSSRS